MRILPDVLKELSKHVPAVLFQSVEWSELALEIPKISSRIIQKEGHSNLFTKQIDLLTHFKISLTKDSLKPSKLSGNKIAGEKILSLYFAQLFAKDGIFLDLRSNHFEVTGLDLTWRPSGLWVCFEENFKYGLLRVYEGFYLNDDELYYTGLEKIGLIRNDFDHADKTTLGNLFKSQFGNALDGEMSFNLEHLKSSIIKMSDFMLEKKITISKDFLYLGIYLVTLYSTLEEINEKLLVKDIYLNVKNHFDHHP